VVIGVPFSVVLLTFAGSTSQSLARGAWFLPGMARRPGDVAAARRSRFLLSHLGKLIGLLRRLC
jgi:hypothetical protein